MNSLDVFASYMAIARAVLESLNEDAVWPVDVRGTYHL